MANTLTNLIPDIYAALDIVSREQAGMITGVLTDSSANRVAKDQTVYVHAAPAASAEDITPGTTPPDTGDQTIGSTAVTISNFRAVPFRWTGEEQAGVRTGPGYEAIRRDQIAQAIRTLVNEVETDLCELYKFASRAYGSSGTTPFGTKDELDDLSYVRQILVDNGAPNSDLQMVLSSAAMANLGGYQSTMWKVNEAGTPEFRQRGMIGSGLLGFAIRETAQAQTHTAGTGTGFDVDATEPVGETTLAVDGGDSGTILEGDVISIAGDSAKYVVASATASAGTSGNIVIREPGLVLAKASGDEITINSTYTPSMAFHRNSVVLAGRLPYVPEEGDMADDRMTVTDPNTGLTFEFAQYRQYRRVRYEVALAWGVKAIKPEHMALLLG